MTHAPILAKWPTVAQFARDIGVGYQTARGMFDRGWIPDAHWLAVVKAAEDQGFTGVTLDKLAKAAANKRKRPEPEPASC